MRHNGEIRIENMPYGARFSILSKAFRREMDENLREYGLTAVQGAVLGAINAFEKEGITDISQRFLEREIHNTHASLTEILRKLEAGGFILMVRNDSDKRSKSIKTTDKAHELFSKIDESDRKIYEEVREGISDEEMADFWTVYGKILSNSCRRAPEGGIK